MRGVVSRLHVVVFTSIVSLMAVSVKAVTISVKSIPEDGVAVWITPADNLGRTNGITPFNCEYDLNDNVTFTASNPALGRAFTAWWQNCGVYTIQQNATIAITGTFTMTCEYTKDVPTAVSASGQCGQIRVTWNSVTGANGYCVYRDGNPLPLACPTASPFTDTDVGTAQHCYQIQATFGCFYPSAKSASACATAAAPLGSVTLLSPPDDIENQIQPLLLDWQDLIGATQYHLSIDDNSDFTSPIVDVNTNSSDYYATGLGDGVTYYWRVRGNNACGWSGWNNPWSFTTICNTLGPVTLLLPPNGAPDLEQPLFLDWEPLSGSTQYNIQVDDNYDFSNPEVDYQTGNSDYNLSGLAVGITYYWRVRGYNGCDWGAWSEIFEFTLRFAQPNSSSFCDSFESGWLDGWTIVPGVGGLPEQITSPVHSGDYALRFHSNASGNCITAIYRSDFEANLGEYSAYVYQTHSQAGFAVYIQVQFPGTYPFGSDNYEIDYQAADAYGGGILAIHKRHNNSSQFLTSKAALFTMNEWVFVFARRLNNSTLIAGYERPNGYRDSIIYEDVYPIIAPGKFVIASCADFYSTAHFWDDVCFESISTDTIVEFSIDTLYYSRPAGHEFDTTFYIRNESDFPVECIIEHTPYIPYSVYCSLSDICTIPAHDSIPVTFDAFTEGCYPYVGMIDTITVLLFVGGNERDAVIAIETVTLNQPPCNTKISLVNVTDSIRIGETLIIDFEDDCPHGLAEDCFQRIDVAYSIDSMVSWVPIDSNIYVNGYDWRIVPDTFGEKLFLKIEGTDWFMVPVNDTAGPFPLYYMCGDANANGSVNILDVTFLIAYLYKNEQAPNPIQAGDANGNGVVNILDATYLLSKLYKSGPAPICP